MAEETLTTETTTATAEGTTGTADAAATTTGDTTGTTTTETATDKKGAEDRSNWIPPWRLAEMAAERRQAREDADRLKAELAELKGKPKQDSDGPAVTGKPEVTKYENYNDYLEAVAEWKAEQKFNQLRQKEQTESQSKEFQSRVEKARMNAITKIGELAQRAPDAEAVLAANRVSYNQPTQILLMESERSADLAYYLAKNQAEAFNLSQMSFDSAAKYIGRLEAKIEAQLEADKAKGNGASKAKPPFSGPAGNKANPATSEYRDDMTDEQFRAWFTKHR